MISWGRNFLFFFVLMLLFFYIFWKSFKSGNTVNTEYLNRILNPEYLTGVNVLFFHLKAIRLIDPLNVMALLKSIMQSKFFFKCEFVNIKPEKLKTQEQISKTNVRKSIVHVIKHANFQVF